jgi:hypothetical protein
MLPAGPLNPFDWLSISGNEAMGVQQGAVMRGHPGALSAYQRRQIAGPSTIAQATPFYLMSRPYSRGAQAYAPKFGVLNVNPIGAGVVAPYKLPVIAGPGARYQLGAIWFDAQTIPTTIRMSPTMPIESVNAMLGMSSVSAMYATTG